MEQAYHLTALMSSIRVQSLRELLLTMENAYRYSLTFYDSAYLTVSEKHGIVLVTEDKQLAKAAQQANIPTTDIETMIKTT
ncbi:type II toxin-antitoxin system VapC family toxin [Candidatus Bathyarchaeota archaeon]|nr:type II toxin-antitoxin system VapC family toxin [Candidatus Bathyarchaeota archaeon]